MSSCFCFNVSETSQKWTNFASIIAVQKKNVSEGPSSFVSNFRKLENSNAKMQVICRKLNSRTRLRNFSKVEKTIASACSNEVNSTQEIVFEISAKFRKPSLLHAVQLENSTSKSQQSSENSHFCMQ